MAEQAALSNEDQRKRLIAIRAAIVRGDDREADNLAQRWIEELNVAKACPVCKGPVAKRLVPAKLLDYETKSD